MCHFLLTVVFLLSFSPLFNFFILVRVCLRCHSSKSFSPMKKFLLSEARNRAAKNGAGTSPTCVSEASSLAELKIFTGYFNAHFQVLIQRKKKRLHIADFFIIIFYYIFHLRGFVVNPLSFCDKDFKMRFKIVSENVLW